MDAATILFQVSIWILPILIAITFHEAAHGFVAWRLGDDTAKRLGRVTFNPVRHIDPVGTVLVPGILLLFFGFAFGWAKPVPVDFRRLNSPRRDMVLVALAGPGINIALALAAAALMHVALSWPGTVGEWLFWNLRNAILINLVLAVFNMLPIPPLDGGRVAVGVLPPALAAPLAGMERIGLLVIILLIFVVPYAGREVGLNLDVFRWLVLVPVQLLYDVVIMLTGHG